MPTRVEFFRVFERDYMHIDPVLVTAGDEAGYGALRTDVRVFDKKEMNEDDYTALELIYGVSVDEAPRYTGMFITSKLLMFLAVCPSSSHLLDGA